MSRQDPPILNDMQIGQPAWRMALLFPPQGSWTEQEYLALDAGRQIEFDRGCVEVLEMPTKEHQRLVRFLFLLMQAFVSSRRLGEVFFAPLPIRLWNEKYREPDLVFLASGRSDVGKYPDGTPAIVEGSVGQGWVILSGVHPEAPESWRRGMAFDTPVSDDTAYARMLILAALNRTKLSHY